MTIMTIRKARLIITNKLPRPADGITITPEIEVVLDAALNDFGLEKKTRAKLRSRMLKVMGSPPVS